MLSNSTQGYPTDCCCQRHIPATNLLTLATVSRVLNDPLLHEMLLEVVISRSGRVASKSRSEPPRTFNRQSDRHVDGQGHTEASSGLLNSCNLCHSFLSNLVAGLPRHLGGFYSQPISLNSLEMGGGSGESANTAQKIVKATQCPVYHSGHDVGRADFWWI